MGHILRIDTSSRTVGSRSRELGDHFEQIWRSRHPRDSIARRDLGADPIGHIRDLTIAGFYTPPGEMTPALREATALSDTLIAELKAADVLLITLPMYNFSVPSAFKAWVDQIVRIGHTFAYDGKSFTGLVTGKRAYVLASYGAGGYAAPGPLAAFDFLRPYVTLLLGFLGISNVEFFAVEATTADVATVNANAAAAKQAILRAIEDARVPA